MKSEKSNRCHTYCSNPEKKEEKNEENEAHHVKFKMRIWQKWDNNTPKDKVGQDDSTCTSLFIKKDQIRKYTSPFQLQTMQSEKFI